MIASKTYINGKLAHIFINPSTTLDDLNKLVIVSMPMSINVVCKNVYRNILVEIDRGKLKWDFIPLYLDEFDAMLGMDGLSYYQANVNYFAR